MFGFFPSASHHHIITSSHHSNDPLFSASPGRGRKNEERDIVTLQLSSIPVSSSLVKPHYCYFHPSLSLSLLRSLRDLPSLPLSGPFGTYVREVANPQYPKAIRVVSGGLIDLKPLVTHRFPLNRATEAFMVASDPSKGAIKVQITD